jgi:hypothetical protein
MVRPKQHHPVMSLPKAIAVKITRSALSVAREMLVNLHAMREMAIMLVCLQIYAQRVATRQKLVWMGIYEAWMAVPYPLSMSGSPMLIVYRRVLIRNPGDLQEETLLPV